MKLTAKDILEKLQEAASQGRCQIKQVGALAVRPDGTFIMSASNGMPPESGLNCLEGDCPRCTAKDMTRSFGYDICGCLHAEEMLLCLACRKGISLEGAILYSSYKPCISCTRKLLASGVEGVRYLEPWSPPEDIVGGLGKMYGHLNSQFPCGSKEITP